MTEGEIYVVLGVFMLMGIIQKPTEIIFHQKKGNFHTRIWRYLTRNRLGIILLLLLLLPLLHILGHSLV
jgi:hypothetical protein